MKLLEILSEKSVKAPLESTDKHAAILELVELLAAADLIQEPEELMRVVWEREQQRSTGIGDGLAIPHGKSDCSSRLVMAIGRPPKPIEFAAIDRKPVKLVVLLASPPARTADHIQALGKISRLMVDPEFREKTYVAESGPELFELFRAADR